MSTTFYTAEARIPRSKYFDLDKFISEVSDQCIREDNFIVENYGVVDGKVDCDLASYVNIDSDDNIIRINVDTSGDTSASDTDVFDWLVDRAVDFTGEYAQVSWGCEDSRSGTSNWSYTIINGSQVDSDTLIQDHKVLNEIASLLSGSEWDSGKICEIVDLIRETGRTVADVVQ